MAATVFSHADIEILLLLKWCGIIRAKSLNDVFTGGDLQNLTAAGLTTSHKGSGALILTEKGSRCLAEAVPDDLDRTVVAYRDDLIQRRLRTSDLALTAYRANCSVFAKSLSDLSQNPSLLLPAISRGHDRNLWGSSRVAALLRLGDLYCGAYNVYPGVGRVNPEDERKTVENCAVHVKNVRTAFLFAGETYADVLRELERRETNKGRLVSYGEMCRQSLLPVHLLSCDATGALQLRLMAQPGYRQRLAQAGLGQGYAPPPKEQPHFDGMLNGVPFVIAADMDLNRLEAACADACKAGFCQIAAAALKGQVQSVLRERYQGKVKLFTITDQTLTAAFGDALPLRRLKRGPYFNQKGDVVDVPPIQSRRKGGR